MVQVQVAYKNERGILESKLPSCQYRIRRPIQRLSTLTVTKEMYFKGILPIDAARRDVSSPIVAVGIVQSFRAKGVSVGRRRGRKAT